MATNWSTGSGQPVTHSSGSTFGNPTPVVPNVGDLMVLAWTAVLATTGYSSASVTDTGSGGWTQIGFLQLSGGGTAVGAWWKIATSADHNGGSGITVTLTASGGSGAFSSTQGQIELYRVSAGTIGGIDLSASVEHSSGTSVNLHPGSGATQPNNIDELAWIMNGCNSNQGGMTCTFAGTSSALSMAYNTNQPTMETKYVGGVQASATAGSNTWAASWGITVFLGLVAATFYYTAASSNMLLVMGQ